MTISKRLISMLMAVLFFASAMFVMSETSIEVDAASAKSKALSAYKYFLSSSRVESYVQGNRSKFDFAIAYVDNNKVPELIVRSGVSTYMFTYKKSQIKYVTYLSCGELMNKFCYYKKTGCYYDCYIRYGVLSESYLKLSGLKCNGKLNRTSNLSGGKANHYKLESSTGGKINITKAKYKSELKKLTKGKKETSVKLRKNTYQNRDKYLK